MVVHSRCIQFAYSQTTSFRCFGPIVGSFLRANCLIGLVFEFLKLVNVLETCAFHALRGFLFVNLTVEELGVCTALSDINVVLTLHFLFELLFSASPHRDIELTKFRLCSSIV